MNTVSRKPLLLGTALMMCATGSMYGCKDFLTEAAAPQGTLTQDVLANVEGVEGNLIATYRSLDVTQSNQATQGAAASNWIWGSVVSDDAYKGSEPPDASGITDIELYNWNAPGAQGWNNSKWRGMFEGISRANATLRVLKQVQTDNPTSIAAEEKGIEGEARFLRAHYYFELWRMYGGVPVLKETDTDVRKPASPAADVAKEILADLDYAIANLAAAPRKGQVGRATSWTAKAYKARLLMYQNQHATALPILREIKASGPYALEASFDRVWTGFQQFANGKETIFAYQASSNDGAPDGNNANYGERLNFPHGGSPFGCCGFHQPSQNLVNFFATDPTSGLPVAVTNPTAWNASNANLTAAAGLAKTVDPRLDWTVGRDDVPYKDWGVHEPNWIRDLAFGGVYSPKKNVHEAASGAGSNVGWVNTQLNSVNIHILRYADILLMLAEAEVEGGNLEAARTIVNDIRTRAGVTAQGCGLPSNAGRAATLLAKHPQCAGDTRMAVPINDPKIKWAQYKVSTYPTFPSQAYARDAVRNERRLELAQEGHRFFDLRRWGLMETTLNAYLNGVAGGSEKTRRSHLAGASPVAQKHLLYPIPSEQLELSKVEGTSVLTQNPGW